MMRSFSVRHKLHRLLNVEYSFALLRVRHSILFSVHARFNSQACFESWVLFCFFSCFSAALWFPYLSLNVVDVEPM